MEIANFTFMPVTPLGTYIKRIIHKHGNIRILLQKFLKGMSATNEMERIAEEKERQARIPAIRKEEQRIEQEGKKYHCIAHVGE